MRSELYREFMTFNCELTMSRLEGAPLSSYFVVMWHLELADNEFDADAHEY